MNADTNRDSKTLDGDEPANVCAAAIGALPNVTLVATVANKSGSVDFALVDIFGLPIVVRCVAEPEPVHLHGLQTMIAQGPFRRAVLASKKESAPEIGLVSRCHVNQLTEALRSIVSESGSWT